MCRDYTSRHTVFGAYIGYRNWCYRVLRILSQYRRWQILMEEMVTAAPLTFKGFFQQLKVFISS